MGMGLKERKYSLSEFPESFAKVEPCCGGRDAGGTGRFGREVDDDEK